MSLEHAILGFLAQEPMTGYDLKTRGFDRAASAFWTADQAHVYRTLDRLQAGGLVRARLVAQRGKPDRKLFAITPKGRDLLDRWLASPPDVAPLRDPFLLRLFFSAGVPDGELLALLETARDEYQSRLDRLRGRAASELAEWAAGGGRERHAALRRMALVGATTQARAAIDWLDDCIDEVGRRRLPAPETVPANADE